MINEDGALTVSWWVEKTGYNVVKGSGMEKKGWETQILKRAGMMGKRAGALKNGVF